MRARPLKLLVSSRTHHPAGQRVYRRDQRLPTRIGRLLSHHIWHERLEQACEKRHSFLNFSYVCPEPVLVKCSFCYKNGSNSGVFRTDAWAIGPVHAEPAETVSRYQLLLYVCPEPVLAKNLE